MPPAKYRIRHQQMICVLYRVYYFYSRFPPRAIVRILLFLLFAPSRRFVAIFRAYNIRDSSLLFPSDDFSSQPPWFLSFVMVCPCAAWLVSLAISVSALLSGSDNRLAAFSRQCAPFRARSRIAFGRSGSPKLLKQLSKRLQSIFRRFARAVLSGPNAEAYIAIESASSKKTSHIASSIWDFRPRMLLFQNPSCANSPL